MGWLVESRKKIIWIFATILLMIAAFIIDRKTINYQKIDIIASESTSQKNSDMDYDTMQYGRPSFNLKAFLQQKSLDKINAI